MAKNVLIDHIDEKVVDKKPTKKGNKTMSAFKKILNGEFLSKKEIIDNLPFFSFVSLLMVLLISWGYYTESIGKTEAKLEKELSELNSEYFTLGSEYNRLSRQTQVAERLKETGLKESTNPPKKIKVNTYVFK
ncbi:MAG: FtsL-like putative cell division protein [Putridiphycobacter sp.]